MARVHERVFALVGVVLFFISSFGLTFLVLWIMHQQSRAQKAADVAQNTTCATTKPNPKDVNVAPKKGSQLQGTQLVDFKPCSVSKLEIIDTQVGTGATVTPTDTVTVDYTGAVTATGTIFQSSLDSGQKATFPLNGVIQGWTEGIPGMKVGGKRRLIIPAAQAYGPNPPQGSNIPVNADLVFDITLYSVSSGSSSSGS